MLPLNDSHWQEYKGGYRVKYDASLSLRKLILGDSSALIFEELCNELHHQNDVGEASYAAVPYLLEFARNSPKLDWNVFALIAIIELCRTLPDNPSVPEELAESYFLAIQQTPEVAINHQDKNWNDLLMQSVAACTALARNQPVFGRIYTEFSFNLARQWFQKEFQDFPDDTE